MGGLPRVTWLGLSLLAGCASAPTDYIAVSANYLRLSAFSEVAIQSAVLEAFGAPMLVTFGPNKAGSMQGGRVLVCGWANASTQMGGTSGMTPFVGEFADLDGPFDVHGVGDTYEKRSDVYKTCRAIGLNLI